MLAACGRGKELHFLSKHGFSAAYAATEPISGLPHKVCNDYFMNLKNNSCVNVDLFGLNQAEPHATDQWCYVPNDCETLNGGQYGTNVMGFQLGGWNNLASTSNLSWKICDPAVDGNVMMKSKTVAEQAERDDEMADFMKIVATQDIELSVEERNLLSVAYKNAVGSRRASWRIVSSMEQKESTK